jgi:hypothetical protein
MADTSARVQGLTDWPWQELGVLSDALYEQLKSGTREVMLAAGENPDDTAWFRIRVRQVAYGVNSQADREGRS